MQCQRGCKQQGFHAAECIVNDCWGCLPAQAEPGLVVCKRCEDRFTTGLHRLIEGWDALDANLGQGMNFQLKERVQGTPDVGLAFNHQVSEVKSKVREWTVFVIRILVTEFAMKRPDVTDTKGLLQVLEKHVFQVLGHSLGADFVDDVSYLVRSVGACVAPVKRSRFSLESASCPQLVDGVVCGSKVVVNTAYRNGKPDIRIICKHEDAHLTSFQDFVLTANDVTEKPGMTMTAGEVALVIGVTSSEVSIYADRNAWTKTVVEGRRLYELADVKQFLEKRKAS